VNNVLASGATNGGIAMISYMNLFEYGMKLPKDTSLYVGGVPDENAPLNNSHWQEGGGYPYAVVNNFTQALVTNGTCSGIYSGRTPTVRCLKRLARSPTRVPVDSWLGGILADPRDGLGYDKIILADLQRHIDHLPAFQGVALDRMDYLQWVNFDGDDNYTFVGEGTDGWTGWSLKRSFLQITKRMRQMMGPSRTFMNNVARHAWLGMQRYQDGIFTELNNLDAYGFLGINSTAIMWTTEESFRGKGGADYYFQRLIRMNVFPLAPFPQNDHATAYTQANIAVHIPYGELFKALVGTTWLLEAEPISLIPSVVTVGMQTNAFFKGSVYTYPIVLGPQNAPPYQNMTSPGPVQAVVSVPSAEAAKKGAPSWSVLHPSGTWQSIAAAPVPVKGKYTVVVPLVRGCALLRADYSGLP
jgi:hypothetical protein